MYLTMTFPPFSSSCFPSLPPPQGSRRSGGLQKVRRRPSPSLLSPPPATAVAWRGSLSVGPSSSIKRHPQQRPPRCPKQQKQSQSQCRAVWLLQAEWCEPSGVRHVDDRIATKASRPQSVAGNRPQQRQSASPPFLDFGGIFAGGSALCGRSPRSAGHAGRCGAQARSGAGHSQGSCRT